MPTSWSIVGQRDFNGDGKHDWLWRDTSGNVAIWLLNGLQVFAGGGFGNVPTNWSIVGTGDFNGDGKGDILWRDTSGNVAIWLMNGLQVSAGGGLGNVPHQLVDRRHRRLQRRRQEPTSSGATPAATSRSG